MKLFLPAAKRDAKFVNMALPPDLFMALTRTAKRYGIARVDLIICLLQAAFEELDGQDIQFIHRLPITNMISKVEGVERENSFCQNSNCPNKGKLFDKSDMILRENLVFCSEDCIDDFYDK